jgi:hypothetical protein
MPDSAYTCRSIPALKGRITAIDYEANRNGLS